MTARGIEPLRVCLLYKKWSPYASHMHHICVLVYGATSENVPTAVNCALQTTSQNRYARVCGNFPVARRTALWGADGLHALWCTSSQIVTGVTLVVSPVQLLKHIVYPCLIVYSHGYALDNTSSGDKRLHHTSNTCCCSYSCAHIARGLMGLGCWLVFVPWF